jgi:hypothetical protein
VVGLGGGLARVVACEKPAHDQKQCAERKEAEVVGGLVACAFADGLKAPQPNRIQPINASPLAAQRHSFVRRHRIQRPTTTMTHRKAWKSPSASVLSSSPATVVPSESGAWRGEVENGR